MTTTRFTALSAVAHSNTLSLDQMMGDTDPIHTAGADNSTGRLVAMLAYLHEHRPALDRGLRCRCRRRHAEPGGQRGGRGHPERLHPAGHRWCSGRNAVTCGFASLAIRRGRGVQTPQDPLHGDARRRRRGVIAVNVGARHDKCCACVWMDGCGRMRDLFLICDNFARSFCIPFPLLSYRQKGRRGLLV